MPNVFTDDQLTRDIRAHIINHSQDNAYARWKMLRAAGREFSLLDVRDAWRRARLEMA
jgi:hypothetical protein